MSNHEFSDIFKNSDTITDVPQYIKIVDIMSGGNSNLTKSEEDINHLISMLTSESNVSDTSTSNIENHLRNT